ncbi:MAG: HAD family phosphatase [Oscillospiraceae bacterium]|nr:HAD family phosphatase [Oscillospiraceae bacterium]
MQPFTFAAAIFDLDGTLLDSMWVWHEVDRAFFAARGMTMPDDYVQTIHGMTFRETAEYTIARFGLHETPAEIMREWNELSALQYRDHVQLKPGAREFLQALNARGVKLATATALTTHVMHAVLQSNGVDALFDAFTSADEVARGKTFPDIYLLAAQKLGVPPAQCIVFEDVRKTIAGIRAAGMKGCAVFDNQPDWDDMLREFDYDLVEFAQSETGYFVNCGEKTPQNLP